MIIWQMTIFTYLLLLSAKIPWLYETPWGMRVLLNWMKTAYGNVPMFIMENGTTDGDTSILDDTHRIDYLKAYISEILKGVL